MIVIKRVFDFTIGGGAVAQVGQNVLGLPAGESLTRLYISTPRMRMK